MLSKRISAWIFFFLALELRCIAVSSALFVGLPSKVLRSSALPANVTLAVEDSVFASAIPLALPYANKALSDVVLPPMQTDKFDIDAIDFTELRLGGAKISMASPNKLHVTLESMEISIPSTKIVVRPGLITCEGSFQASIRNTNASFEVNVSRLTNGTLRLSTVGNSIQWGYFKISHEIFGTVCKIAEKVVEVVLGNLDNFVVKKVKEELPENINQILEQKSAEFFDWLPVNFTEDPNITSGRLVLAMDLVPGEEGGREAQLLARFTASEAPLPPREVAAVSSAAAITNFLTYLFQRSMLNVSMVLPAEYNSSLIQPMFPEAFEMCPNCPFMISLVPMAPPLFEQAPDETLILQLKKEFVGFGMESPLGVRKSLIDLLVNVTGGVTRLGFNAEDLLKFKLKDLDLSMDVLTSNIGQVDSKALSRDLCWLFNNVVAPLFNVQFEGLALPSQISRPILNISGNSIAAGFDVTQEFHNALPFLFSFASRVHFLRFSGFDFPQKTAQSPSSKSLLP